MRPKHSSNIFLPFLVYPKYTPAPSGFSFAAHLPLLVHQKYILLRDGQNYNPYLKVVHFINTTQNWTSEAA
jgi:hypothetical protein